MRRRILVTGMSGTGKSTVLAELARQGLRVVDTDGPGWGDGVRWNVERMEALLREESHEALVVSGCVENQVVAELAAIATGSTTGTWYRHGSVTDRPQAVAVRPDAGSGRPVEDS